MRNGKLKTTEQFIKEAKEKHGEDSWVYSETKYEGIHKKLIIICPIHGSFKQVAKVHLSGSGCPTCSRKEGARKRKKIQEDYIIESLAVHSNKYKYEKLIYTGALDKVIITCPIHGDFKQLSSNHLQGAGCKKCAGMLTASAWSRSDYIKKAKGRLCTFYTIRCFNETEEFYKIGITMESIKKRYNHVVKMPYAYEVISENKGEAGFIWDLEVSEKRKLKEFHYIPEITFNGSKTECFTQYENNVEGA